MPMFVGLFRRFFLSNEKYVANKKEWNNRILCIGTSICKSQVIMDYNLRIEVREKLFAPLVLNF